jgi:hypothetical protein
MTHGTVPEPLGRRPVHGVGPHGPHLDRRPLSNRAQLDGDTWCEEPHLADEAADVHRQAVQLDGFLICYARTSRKRAASALSTKASRTTMSDDGTPER